MTDNLTGIEQAAGDNGCRIDLKESVVGPINSNKLARERIEESVSLFDTNTPDLQVHRASLPYPIREVQLDDALNKFAKSWTNCHRQSLDRTLCGDPEWIEERFKHQKDKVRLFLLEKDHEVAGEVTFVLNREKLACELGEFVLSKFPMDSLILQGPSLNLPKEPAVYDALFSQIVRSDFDAIRMENVNAKSFLWQYLQGSAVVRREFCFYIRKRPLSHFLIRLEGTFENYMKRFTAKTRKNRFREIRLLLERGPLHLVTVSQPSEIDGFLKAAYEISKRTWKFRHRRYGLAVQDRETVTRELRFLADRGWLRSYVLTCDGVPCSFILGHQYGSSFYAETVGVDDAWRSYSAGTVILMLVLKDLFKKNSPKFYDFGTHVKFQEIFATESYPEATVWLLRRRAYPVMARIACEICDALTMGTGALLEGFGVKSKLKKMLWYRGLPSRS